MRAPLPPTPSRPRRLGNLPIRVRLTLWYVALMALVLIAFSAFLYLSLAGSLRQQMDAGLTAAAGQLQAAVDLENGRPAIGRDQLQPASGVTAALYDPTGTHLLDGAPRWPDSSLGALRDRAALGQAGFATVGQDNGDGWRVLASPVQENGRTVGVLEVGRSERDLEAALRQLLLLMGLAVPAVLALATAGGLFLAQRALSPIDRITRIANRIGAEDLSQRLGMPAGGDEVGRLAATFDGMLERLDGAFRRQRQFTADASHELRTPLAVATSHIDVALERPRSVEEYQEVLRLLGAEVARMRDLVSQLLTLARADSGTQTLEREPVALDQLATEVVDQLVPLAESRCLRLGTGRVDPVVVLGDQTRLMQLLFNLIENALSYTPEGGRITVDVARRDAEAILSVADTGIGIAAQHLPHIFERFYRADGARSRAEAATGLGLAIGEWIARAHGGRIQVDSTPGLGSTFTVFLPLAPGATSCVLPQFSA